MSKIAAAMVVLLAIQAHAADAIPPSIQQACASVYGEDKVEVAACEVRLNDKEKAETHGMLDSYAEQQARDIETYGSLDAAKAAHARLAEIDRLCDAKASMQPNGPQIFATCVSDMLIADKAGKLH